MIRDYTVILSDFAREVACETLHLQEADYVILIPYHRSERRLSFSQFFSDRTTFCKAFSES